MLVYGYRNLCSNLAGIDPEKLYRATFIGQYGLCCCIVWPSFLFDCFVKFGQLARIFWANGLPPPPWPKTARTPMHATTLEKRKIKRLNCLSLEAPDTFSIFNTSGQATKIKPRKRKGKEKSYGRQNIKEIFP